MNIPEILKLTAHNEKMLADAIRERTAGYLPDWRPGERGVDAALVAILSRFFSVIGTRLNQAPDKNLLAFLEIAGIERIPAQSARAPIAFKTNPLAADGRVPKGSRIAAPPPPGSNEQIIFETENDLGLAAAKLVEVVSVHPGRDQFADHTQAFLSGEPFESFSGLVNAEHIFYLGHKKILNLAGNVTLKVSLALAANSSEHLDIFWEYWDGKLWRPFASVLEKCDEELRYDLDGTNGLMRSGAITLTAGCAESKPLPVNGIEIHWVRGRLLEPLPNDPTQILPLVESVKLKTVINRPLLLSSIDSPPCQITFESLALNVSYGKSQGYKSGDVIFTENNIPVSVHEFVMSNATGAKDFRNCTVKPSDGDFGIGQLMQISNLNLKFDFSSLGLVANEVTFEFKSQGKVENISVNGAPIFVGELKDAPSDIAPGVKLSKELIDDRKGTITLIGPVQTLLVGGDFLLLDNICARNIVSLHKGLLPDKAFAGTAALDLTKAFYPFGQQPQPGSVFYFSNAELFSKPKAHAQVFMKTASTPEQQINVLPGPGMSRKEGLLHEIVWEYWNGTDWVAMSFMPINNPSNVADFEQTDIYSFDVPNNIVDLKINDEEAKWMRARLVSGGYGFKAGVSWSDSGSQNQFTYVIPQPPALAEFRLGYTWESEGEAPEATLAFNDFQYHDFSTQARYPGRPVLPFSRMSDTIPALYLGFDKKLPVDFVNLFFNISENRGEETGPERVWEYWDGSVWRRISVQDETGHLSRPGMLALIGPEDAVALARFGSARYWLRSRLREDGPLPGNLFNAIYLNAVWASQRQTVRTEVLGQSSGLPNQFFRLRQFPVLAGEKIEVRELAGPLAEIEYPILRDSLGEERLRTVINRFGKVSEVWVRWESQSNLFFSGLEERHYVINRADGRLFFGDGVHGKIPPAKALILANEYQAGGGKSGNVSAGSVKQLLVGVPGVQEAFNPLSAEGGTDAEPIASIIRRGPASLRYRGCAMTARDYEVMAREASPEVAWVRIFPATDAYFGHRPGHVLIMVLPETKDRRPWPSFGLRERVRKYLEANALASLGPVRCIHVTGPEYFPIDVNVTLVPENSSEAGTIEHRVRIVLENFLHPLHGGPDANGWELGRDVFLSDIAAVVENVQGVDFAQEIVLLRDHTPQGDSISVPRDRLVMAGEIRVQVMMS